MTVKELQKLLYTIEDDAEVTLLHVDAPLRAAQPIQDVIACRAVADRPERLILMCKAITPDDVTKLRKEGRLDK